jgi:hypothetical protein
LESAVAATVRHEAVATHDPGPYPQRYRTWRELFTTLNATTVP